MCEQERACLEIRKGASYYGLANEGLRESSEQRKRGTIYGDEMM
jgi:hypothetical protein